MVLCYINKIFLYIITLYTYQLDEDISWCYTFLAEKRPLCTCHPDHSGVHDTLLHRHSLHCIVTKSTIDSNDSLYTA
jgi:hypothetical protein